MKDYINSVIQGDCLETLKTLPDNSIDSIVTDPPYGLSFMGKKWDYDVPSTEIWIEALRVLKPGGHLLSFGGSRTYHRMAVAIEDAGFEIRDQIMWVYGSGFPKSLNIGKAVDKLQRNERDVIGKKEGTYADIRRDENTGQDSLHGGIKAKDRPRIEVMNTKGKSPWEGWGTALKPAHEPIVLARKPLSEKTIANNVLEWGTGGINIEGCRVETDRKNEPRQYDKEKASGMNCGDDWFGTNKIKLTDFMTQGRFPANFIHDGSDEVVGLFPDSSTTGNRIKPKTANNPGANTNFVSSSNTANEYTDSGSAARFFYCAKASKKERNAGLEGMEEKEKRYMATANGTGETSKGMERFTTQPTANNHPTVKPIALMEYLIRLITPPQGTVLDPFAGSGTTGVACKNLNRNYILIEKEPEYIEIIKKRLDLL